MFGATNKGIDNDKSKYVRGDYGMAFDVLDSWSYNL